MTAIIVTVISCSAAAASAAMAAPAPISPEMVTVTLTGHATPGKVKVGDKLTFTVTVQGTGKYELSVLVPDGSAPLSPSQPLRDELSGPNVWSPQSGKLQKLTFGAILRSPPGASGTGLWCMNVMVAPSFATKSPPTWTKGQSICYRATAKKQNPGA